MTPNAKMFIKNGFTEIFGYRYKKNFPGCEINVFLTDKHRSLHIRDISKNPMIPNDIWIEEFSIQQFIDALKLLGFDKEAQSFDYLLF